MAVFSDEHAVYAEEVLCIVKQIVLQVLKVIHLCHQTSSDDRGKLVVEASPAQRNVFCLVAAKG